MTYLIISWTWTKTLLTFTERATVTECDFHEDTLEEYQKFENKLHACYKIYNKQYDADWLYPQLQHLREN